MTQRRLIIQKHLILVKERNNCPGVCVCVCVSVEGERVSLSQKMEHIIREHKRNYEQNLARDTKENPKRFY